MKGIGVQHIGVADTIGVGTPLKVAGAIEATLKHLRRGPIFQATSTTPTARRWPTRSMALQLGVWQFDTSVAGPGRLPLCQGCHRQRGVRGRGLHAARHGYRDRHRPGPLVDAGAFISGFLERKPKSRAATAILNKRVG
jgi:hydroxymethylglutaryl-CoA lyase